MYSEERIAEIRTVDGIEEVPVHVSKIDGDMLLVSHPIGARGDDVLIELPQETMRGYWRVWVNKSELEGASE